MTVIGEMMPAAINLNGNERIELLICHQQIHPFAVNRRMHATMRMHDNFA
jgi:hypothetical protein